MNDAFSAFQRGFGSAVGQDDPELPVLVERAVARAEREAGDLAFDRETFAVDLGRMAQTAPDVVEYLREVRAGELHLTRACATGDTRALEQLERSYFGEIGRALARVRGNVSHEDLAQMVRERLYVARAAGKAPRIAEYSGRGDLRTWLRVTTTRTLLNATSRKREMSSGDDDLLEALPSLDADPEVELAKQHYARELGEAFAAAAGSLSARERRLLRHAFLDKLSIDVIGNLYGVHRATAARWINGACEALNDRVQRELSARLKIDRSELRGVLGMIQSRLDISVRRYLDN